MEVSYPSLIKAMGFPLHGGLLNIMEDIKTYVLSTGLKSRSSYGI